MKFRNIYTFLFLLTMAAMPAMGQSDFSDEELLNMSWDELMDINVVSVSKLNVNNLSEVPSAVTVVTGEQILNSGAKNMEEVMRNVAGFDVVRTGINPSTNFGVRGLFSTTGTNNKILFLLNDHPIQSIFLGDASVFLGNLPLHNIEQIEIIRGPGSTLFGAGAFLAVINVRTKHADGIAEVSGAAGSFSTINPSGLATFKSGEDLKISVSADYFKTDGPGLTLESDLGTELLDPFARNLIQYGGPTTSGAPGNLNYDRTTYNVNLKANYKDFYAVASYMNSEDKPLIGIYEALTENNSIKNTASSFEAGYRARLINEQAELLVKSYYDHFSYNANTDLWDYKASLLFDFFANIRYILDPAFTGTVTNYPNTEALYVRNLADNDKFGGEVNFAYNFGNYVNVLGGVMLERHRLLNPQTFANGNFFLEFDKVMIFDSEMYLSLESFGEERNLTEDYSWIEENERTVSAFFGQAELDLKNIFGAYSLQHFNLVMGARYDYYTDAGGSLNPRVALLFAPASKLYFKALYGEAFRAPSFNELYSQNNSIFIGNPDLKPEKVRTMEAIAGVKPLDKFNVTLTYFNTRIDENIQLVADDDPNTLAASTFDNVGNLRTQGVELEFQYDFMEGGYFSGSMTYQDILDITNGVFTASNFQTGEQFSSEQEDFNPGNIPNLIVNVTANYPVTKNINLNVSSNYLGERVRTERLSYELDQAQLPTGSIVSSDDRDPIPSRTILNASVRFHSFRFVPGLQLQFSGYNLLDEGNFNPTAIIGESDLQREGINWMGKLIFRF